MPHKKLQKTTETEHGKPKIKNIQFDKCGFPKAKIYDVFMLPLRSL